MAQAPDPATSLTEQAAWWWQVFEDGEATAAEHREFAEWVARSPQHVEAYLETAGLHKALRSPSIRWPDDSREQLILDARAAPPEPVALQSHAASAPVRPPRATPPRLRWMLATAAAAFVAFIGVAISWTMLGQTKKYVTALGEQRSVMLDDGTRVTLNTASQIEVKLRRTHRSVRLVRGEALFEVAPDAGRPFDVNAGNATVRAVGTQFNVDTRPRQTTVTVIEGRVAYVSGQVPVLVAGDRLVVGRDGAATMSHGVDVDSALAWTRKQLVFERRPLGEVAEEFNRYNPGRIFIESDSLRAEEVTGTFQSHDPRTFVQFLANIPGVVVSDDGAGGYVITAETS